MRIYISGPIKGRPNAEMEFLVAENIVKKAGHEPVNPFRVVGPGHSYEYCMRMDLKALLDCDAIWMLAGWQNSVGASLEQSVAEIIGLPFVTTEELNALSRR